MILLDATILLEILIAGRVRRPEVVTWLEQNTQPFSITPLTVHLVLHFGLKDNLTFAELRTFPTIQNSLTAKGLCSRYGTGSQQ